MTTLKWGAEHCFFFVQNNGCLDLTTSPEGLVDHCRLDVEKKFNSF